MRPPEAPSEADAASSQGASARWVPAAAGLLAAVALAGVYFSGHLPFWANVLLRIAEIGLVGVFVVDRVCRFRQADHREQFLQDHWLDLSLLAAAGVAVLIGLGFRGPLLPAAAMYILVSRLWRIVPRAALPAALNVVLGLAGMVAVAALVLEYGFREPPIARSVLHAVETVVVAIFILDRVARLELSRSRPTYLRENWVDFALLAVAGAAVVAARQLAGQILSAGALYVIITQGYILTSLILRGVSVNLDFAGSGIHPTWLLIGSFAAMCLAGSGLLMLPAATPEAHPIGYLDALFTATSATCVTGLVVRDTGTEFTVFGQAVILGLIQLGGLGIMLFGTVLALLVGRGLSVRSSEALGWMIGTEGIGRLARIVKFVVAVTLALEVVGAVLLYPMFAAPQGALDPTAGQAAWNSAFHSISAFCNAGFALYRNNMMQGVAGGWAVPLRRHWQVLGVIAPLIVLGGIGFPVIEDCARYVKAAGGRLVRRLGARGRRVVLGRRASLSLHSKIVLATSGVLIVLGTAGVLLLGPGRASRGQRIGGAPLEVDRAVRDDPARWRNLPSGRKLQAALFQSITARTAGFNTIDMRTDLNDGGRLLMCGLMVVGGSPASTAGGMKTATFALLMLATWSMIKRRNEVEAFRRTVAAELLRKTVTLAVLYLALLAVVTLLLCVAMPGHEFMRLLFEACSACGTVGLSTGITSALTFFGKVVVIGGMFVGRVGPLTLLLALTIRMRHVRYAYPSEHVVIG